MPGLIDAHIHLHGRTTLEHLCSWGVTTGLDMATWPPEMLNSLRNVDGLTDIRSPGIPLIGPSGPHSHFGMSADAVVTEVRDADRFVSDRGSVEAGLRADLILIDGDPSPTFTLPAISNESGVPVSNTPPALSYARARLRPQTRHNAMERRHRA